MVTPSIPPAPLFLLTSSHALSRVPLRHTLSHKLNHFPPLTPLTRAANMRSVHTTVSTLPLIKRVLVSDSCLASSTYESPVYLVPWYRFHASTFLHHFPSPSLLLGFLELLSRYLRI